MGQVSYNTMNIQVESIQNQHTHTNCNTEDLAFNLRTNTPLGKGERAETTNRVQCASG